MVPILVVKARALSRVLNADMSFHAAWVTLGFTIIVRMLFLAVVI